MDNVGGFNANHDESASKPAGTSRCGPQQAEAEQR
jgi:hypothetical protein